MLTLVLLATNSVGFSARAAVAAEPGPIAGQGYHQVFGDEFDTFDTGTWDKDLWWKSSPLNAVAAENGILHLRSRRSQGYPDVGIVTLDPNDQAPNRSFLLGYFETRMRWTVTPGAWPAFWMGTIAHALGPPPCPYDNAELDIFEGQGDEPTTFYGTVHKNTNSPCGIADQTNQGWRQVPSMSNAFHVYSALWTSSQICWYFDNVQTHCAPTYAASGQNTGTNQAMWLALEMQANGWDATNQTGPHSPDVLDAEIDWMHVWQKQAGAPANTVRPALSGTARQGEALTTTNGTWTGTAPITYSYGWTRCDANGNNCSAIPGATSQSYVLTAADVGSKVSSLVTATNAAGSASQRSYLSALVVGTPPANTVRPALSGTARQGEALTTTNGTWTGTAPITYSYGWTRCDANGNNCSAIPGATSQSYVLTAADVGSKVSSLVTATNAAGSASQRSYLSALVVGTPPANTVRPALSGTARQGEALTTTNGTWTGTAPITYSYGWTRCDANGNNCSAIPGATSQSYVLTAADVGSKVSSLVTATNAAGSASQRSYLSALVVAAP